MTIKEIAESQVRLHGQMTALVDKARAEKRDLTAEENAKFDEIDADLNKLSERKERLGRYEAHTNRLNALSPTTLDSIGVGPAQNDGSRAEEYAAAFKIYCMVGLDSMPAAKRDILLRGPGGPQAALSPATGVGGGFLIPQGFEDQLVEAREWFGGIDQFSDTITTDTGNVLPWPTANDTVNTGEIIGPNTQLSMAQPTFGDVVFGAYKFSSKTTLVPNEIFTDSAFDLDTWLPKNLGIRIARIENNKFTVGAGIVEPTGIVTAAAAAGNVVTMSTGNTTTIASDNFIDLESAVDIAYRKGSKYMLADSTLRVIKKLKDATGRYLWQPGLTASLAKNSGMTGNGMNATINGYEYVLNNDMPALGASQFPVAFGDYTNFKIRRVRGYTVRRLVERYADYDQVGFLCLERADSNLLDAGTHPVALLQNSAS